MKMKKNINLENFCQDLPMEILAFCKYTRKLEFTEKPKYAYLKSLLYSLKIFVIITYIKIHLIKDL